MKHEFIILINGKLQNIEENPLGNINALVEFNFESADSSLQIIKVAFDADGNYYFEGNWYEIDSLMYYYLFKSLSDDIIQVSVMNSIKTQIKRKGPCWFKS